MEALMERVDIRHPSTGKVLFAHEELQSPDTGEVRLHPGFADNLAYLRMVFGRPMVVTSCCRSAAHNAAIGGHPRSLHVHDRPNHGLAGAAAIDISATDGVYRRELLRQALDLGWAVGVSRSFLHLDRRDLVGMTPIVFAYGGK
ncbi:hypothetical protein DRB17_19230 [Ferruginivarius sediminum]|uniref:Peptidase M15A C-terminal domain-containing protein n=2 Tax=Ferruginivarius sediminum TaxID=2661937 RepID=A0A369T4E9_9PROT|nr:hypothetical protein DRB17_19230 [Ferruginivarius sediminum]